MTQDLAYVLFYVGFGLLLIAGAVWFLDRLATELLASPEEVTRRESERLAKKASKEFNRQQLVRRFRAWLVGINWRMK